MQKGGKTRAGGSIHVSLKPKGGRTGQGSYWFDFRTQAYSGNNSWGTIPFVNRQKAQKILGEFVQEFTRIATAVSAPPPPLTVVPSISTISPEEAEEAFMESKNGPPLADVPDSWDDDL